MGIPDQVISLLRNLYAGQEATVRNGHGHEDARLAHWKFYTVAEKDPEYMDRYSIAMERLKMAIPWNASSI